MSVKEISQKEIAMHVSRVSILINVLLSLIKLFAGLLAKSGAMISDSIHSASDVLSTFIVMIGVHVSSKTSDEDHPYGHERFECVASILLSILLAGTGFGIGYKGLKKIFAGNYGKLIVPGEIAIFAAILSIIIKECMYWYTRNAATKIHSGALMADAWHHRSDALSSVGAFVGIFGARMGYPILDNVASVVICIFILKAAFDIFKDAMDKLVDKSCCDYTIEEMRKIIMEQEGVLGVDEIRTRLFGTKIYVDVEIAADGDKTLRETHEIAENVHLAVEHTFPEVKHCMVHVNPADDNK